MHHIFCSAFAATGNEFVSEFTAVICDELFKVKTLSSEHLDTLDYSLTRYCTEIWHIIVHTGIWFRTEHALIMEVTAFVYIHDVLVTVIKYKVPPLYVTVSARSGEVSEPAY